MLKTSSANRRVHTVAQFCQVFQDWRSRASGVLLAVALCGGTAIGDDLQRVRLGADGRFFVNDAAVFPIGYTSGPMLGAVAPSGRDGLAELKREGYVFQLWYCPPNTWGPAREQQLDALVAQSERQGTRLVISIHDLQAIKPGEQAKLA